MRRKLHSFKNVGLGDKVRRGQCSATKLDFIGHKAARQQPTFPKYSCKCFLAHYISVIMVLCGDLVSNTVVLLICDLNNKKQILTLHCLGVQHGPGTQLQR